MNYYEALQVIDEDGTILGWRYTRKNDGLISAVGYCAGYLDPSRVADEYLREQIIRDCEPFKHKYHDTPHSTEKEAQDCYRDYLLDQRLSIARLKIHECRICDAPATVSVYYGGTGSLGRFCDLHGTVEYIRGNPELLVVCESMGSE